ncbi:carboxylesterase/lipase family protein [Tsukamurella pulmonis]|uniref:carboxylesterase/lipase family protein n=1 Tax=Tsukamurella pulmonis TaxID=47312 RepID=UPI0009E87BA6|nr:carboxylesterase family protein [Tsukamurella pulmonis]RDH10158.1 carboxylesterase/lipase family protein [Tsukamurella pulmonis]
MGNPVVDCPAGEISGALVGGVARYLGIPYAQPPVGERRFRLPEPVDRLPGVFRATEFGPTPPASMELPEPYSYPMIEGDDWLTLNVWAPADAEPGAKLPVYVWIYGGSFAMGSSAQSLFDGTAFARDGIVYVSINYRVGLEGFTHLADAPDNRGLHDQILALQWVQENIEAFGGDPARVTIGGESAGSMSVSTLATTTYAGSLFQQVICESGIGVAAPVETARKAAMPLHAGLGLHMAAKALRDGDPRQHAAAVAKVMRTLSPHNVLTLFPPVIDGDLVPVNPAARLASGPVPVRMLIGNNRKESDFWRVFGEFVPSDRTLTALGELLRPFGAVPPVVAAYQEVYGSSLTAGEIFLELLSDGAFGGPTYAAQTGQGENCYAYYFTWPSSIHTKSAMHTLDLGFAFDNIADPGFTLYGGEDAPQELADDVHGRWVDFITTGTPGAGWSPFRSEEDLHVFGPAAERNTRALSAWTY